MSLKHFEPLSHSESCDGCGNLQWCRVCPPSALSLGKFACLRDFIACPSGKNETIICQFMRSYGMYMSNLDVIVRQIRKMACPLIPLLIRHNIVGSMDAGTVDITSPDVEPSTPYLTPYNTKLVSSTYYCCCRCILVASKSRHT